MQDGEPAVQTFEMSVGTVRVVFEKDAAGAHRVHRILSTDPADYMRPELQPGAVWTDEPRR